MREPNTFKQRLALRRLRVAGPFGPLAANALGSGPLLDQMAADLAAIRRHASCITDVLHRADAGDALYAIVRPEP